jgi:hypothetical protein
MNNINSLIGKTLDSIEGMRKGSERITVKCSDGSSGEMFHVQDCCECVQVEDVCGEVDDLVGSPILDAREETNSTDAPPNERADSYTWTFYILATIKGSVTIRWLGESNGYYSESVDFELSKPKETV